MTQSALFDGTIQGSAIFEGPYRYHLRRSWSPELGRVVFIMLNPSTATAEVLDNTVRRCLAFTATWGYGELDVVNLFGLMATDPHNLLHGGDPIGPDNDRYIHETAAAPEVKKVICAWGQWGYLQSRGALVRGMLKANKIEPWCLGTTQSGEPKHPLYISGTTPLARL